MRRDMGEAPMNAVDLVVARLGNARQVAGGFVAPCPAHKGEDPKLTIRPGTEGVLLKCWSHGCAPQQIAEAIGLEVRDLFDRHEVPLPTPTARPQREPTWEEIDDAVSTHLQRIVAERRQKFGYAPPPLTSEHINNAHRLVSRQLGITLPRVPPTPRERAHAKEHLDRALAERRSIYSPKGKDGLDYLTSRKIDLNDNAILSREWVEANVKYHPSWLKCVGLPALIFAVRDHLGVVVAVSSRYINPRNPKEKAFSKGLVRLGGFQTPGALTADVVGIVEGPIDALSLALCGLPSIATIGSSYDKPFFWKYFKARRFLICTDNDNAGDSAAAKLAAILGDRCERFTFPENVKDANAWLTADASGLRSSVTTALKENAHPCGST
jgi:hypothetical protein